MSDFDDGSVELGSARSTIVTGFFDSRAEADSAAERLRALGLGGQVRVTEGAGGSGVTDATDSDLSESRDERGFFERLGDFLFPDEDRSTYAEGLSRGGYLVTVTGLTSTSYDLVMDALEDAGAVDIDERAASWRSEGWSGGASSSDESLGRAGSAGVGAGTGYASQNVGGSSFGSGATGAGNVGSELPGEGRSGMGSSGSVSGTGSSLGASSGDDFSGSDETVPVVEERLRVGKRDTSHGRVRVRSYVVEEPVSETVRLEEERVEVERHPVDRAVGAGDGDLFRDRSIEAEEYREEAVVSKEARVVEEVGLRRTHDSHEETVSDTVRRTEVEIDDGRGTAGSSGGYASGRKVSKVEAERGLDDDDDATDRDATGLTERDVNRP